MVLAQLYLNDGWAKGDAPGGISNAWTEPGGMLQQAITTPNLAELTGYCDNANYSYSPEISHSLRLSVRLSCRPS